MTEFTNKSFMEYLKPAGNFTFKHGTNLCTFAAVGAGLAFGLGMPVKEVVCLSLINGVIASSTEKVFEKHSPYVRSAALIMTLAAGAFAIPYIAQVVFAKTATLLTYEVAMKVAALNLATRVGTAAAVKLTQMVSGKNEIKKNESTNSEHPKKKKVRFNDDVEVKIIEEPSKEEPSKEETIDEKNEEKTLQKVTISNAKKIAIGVLTGAAFCYAAYVIYPVALAQYATYNATTVASNSAAEVAGVTAGAIINNSFCYELAGQRECVSLSD